MTPVFFGAVHDGKLSLDKSQQFKEYLHSLNGKRVELTVEKLKHPRSNNQNRYYWGVVAHEFVQPPGDDPEGIDGLLKQMFSPRWHLFGGPGPIPTSTSRFDTLQF